MALGRITITIIFHRPAVPTGWLLLATSLGHYSPPRQGSAHCVKTTRHGAGRRPLTGARGAAPAPQIGPSTGVNLVNGKEQYRWSPLSSMAMRVDRHRNLHYTAVRRSPEQASDHADAWKSGFPLTKHTLMLSIFGVMLVL